MRASSIGLFVIALLVLSILPLAFWRVEPAAGGDAAEFTRRYLAALYARDYGRVYSLLSAEDRKAKSRDEYLTENPSFSGPALEVARGLARMIELKDVRADVNGDRASVRFAFRAPDANNPAVQRVAQDFDAGRLTSLSQNDRRAIEREFEDLRARNELPMIEGEDKVDLIKEAGQWRIATNTAGAIRVRFSGEVKEGLAWDFRPLKDAVLARPGETLRVVYTATNRSERIVTGKARHIDDPDDAEKYLEIVQCFCFIRETLGPGETKEFPLVFRVTGAVPESIKEFHLTYQFYPIEKFPKG
ncbi:MAG TPA: cytochrome c oxidase assembly protein [Candidatus Binatia bacterium]|jgi:hypothetical protein